MNIREALQRQSPSLELQRAAADEIARLDAQIAKWQKAALAAAITVRDFYNGWPADEMHEPPSDTLARIDELMTGRDA